jgi:hypothetical protein
MVKVVFDSDPSNNSMETKGRETSGVTPAADQESMTRA